jgi:hypothetical protein
MGIVRRELSIRRQVRSDCDAHHGSVTLLHDEEASINDLMSSLGTDR